jgi:hypothetical protein
VGPVNVVLDDAAYPVNVPETTASGGLDPFTFQCLLDSVQGHAFGPDHAEDVPDGVHAPVIDSVVPDAGIVDEAVRRVPAGDDLASPGPTKLALLHGSDKVFALKFRKDGHHAVHGASLRRPVALAVQRYHVDPVHLHFGHERFEAGHGPG